MRGIWYTCGCVVLMISFALSLCITAMASSVNNPLCEFTIISTDETDGRFDGRINVTLTDLAGGNKYSYNLSLRNYLLGVPIKGIILANTTYEVDVSLGPGGFALYDIWDDTPVEWMQTTESDYVAQWGIRSTNLTSAPTSDPTPRTTPGPRASGPADAIPPEPETSEPVEQDINPQPADCYDENAGTVLFEEFYRSVKHMDGNPDFSKVFAFHEAAYAKVHASRYASFTSGKESDWYDFSPFKRFLWHETYLQVLTYYTPKNFDYFFKSEEDYLEKVVNKTIKKLGDAGNGTEMNAYKDLMRWQYYYTKANDAPYNFMADMMDLDEFDRKREESGSISQEVNDPGGGKGGPTEALGPDKSVPSIKPEESVPSIKPEDPLNKAIEGLKASVFTFIILFLFTGAWIGIMIHRKNNDIKVVSEH